MEPQIGVCAAISYPLIYVFGFLALVESLYSVVGGIEYSRLLRKWINRCPGDFAPPATLIVPCRGIDPGLEANLSAYFEQDYPDFQILLVTGERDDLCVDVLRQMQLKYPDVSAQILFAGKANKRGQKVHNLLCAVGHVRTQDEVFAFGDSDIRPSSLWLRYLIDPLQDESVGISTGFRWYLSQRGNFASLLRSVWNAGSASLMKDTDCYFAWGGAMAIQRELFQICKIKDRWENALSDDFVISRAIHQHGLSIRFQPLCLSFSHEDCTLKQLWKWSVRQLSLTRIYHPSLWKKAVLSQVLFSSALWGGSFFILCHLWNKTLAINGRHEVLILTVVMIYGLSCVKGWIRLRSLLLLFPHHRRVLQKGLVAYVCWGPLASLISLVGLFCSLCSRKIWWRGILYKMVSPDKTLVLK